MSTGISISSINRIKELAEEKKFAEALEILDTQNLEKSINPQFLRISGEIFRENKRYYDSRKILLRAHQMSPQGNRIIFELILLYLELGYFEKALTYYEQYKFYSTEDDMQKDFVEYYVKKATGAEIKELASIMIPILELMPEDKWNFEAILLYHKLDRKDKALEESRFFLENYKESRYIDSVIAYIDDRLDVDKHFYVYPKEEQPENVELFGDLIELEEKLLAADHLLMYPPEAKIMIKVDDNDPDEVRPTKEKKEKKKKNPPKSKKMDSGNNIDSEDATEKSKKKSLFSRKKKDETEAEAIDEKTETTVGAVVVSNEKTEDSKVEDAKSEEKMSDVTKEAASEETNASTVETDVSEKKEMTDSSDSTKDAADMETSEKKEESVESAQSSEHTDTEAPVEEVSEEEKLKQEREAALDKILSKKSDKDKILESAKQMAKAVKEIDTDKAKQQVKSVAVSVKDNVKKASDVLGEAVGTTAVVTEAKKAEEEFVDGIIEGVLEAPKRAVGEVVVDQELDALVPDSLEAVSSEEIAEREARKEEIERLELEALETALKLEEEKKKAKAKNKKPEEETSEADSMAEQADGMTVEEVNAKEQAVEGETVDTANVEAVDGADTSTQMEASSESDKTIATNELKEKYLQIMGENIEPIASLGLIPEEEKDKFVADAEEKHVNVSTDTTEDDFVVEDYEFELIQPIVEEAHKEDLKVEPVVVESKEDGSLVEDIYVDKQIVDFDEIVPEYTDRTFDYDVEASQYMEEVKQEESVTEEEFIEVYEEADVDEFQEIAYEEPVTEVVEEYVYEEPVTETVEEYVYEEPVTETVEEYVYEEPVTETAKEYVYEEPVTETVEEYVYEEPVTETVEEYVYEESVAETVEEEYVFEDSITETEEVSFAESVTDYSNRDILRYRIILTEDMVRKLLELKESR